MCQEHYQLWKVCNCRGFLEIKICAQLFKACLGPSGDDKDKIVMLVHPGRCDECGYRALQQARDEAQAAADAEALSAASVTTVSSPEAQSSVSGSVFSGSGASGSGSSRTGTSR